MPRFFSLLPVIVVALTAPWAAARDIHVDNRSGDDRFDGRPSTAVAAMSGPVRSIAKALRLAEAGDRIVLAKTEEPYRESVSLTHSKHSGSATRPFMIEGNGAVLDGTGEVPKHAWTHAASDVFSFAPSGLGWQQLFLAGRPLVRHPAQGGSQLDDLEPLEWRLAAGRIYFRVAAGRLPADYPLACCVLRTGITLYNVRDVVIRNLTVQGFQFDAIAAANVVADARLVGVNCHANGRSGVSVYGASHVELTECSLSGNGDSQLLSEEYSRVRIYDSQLVADTAPAIMARGGSVTIDGRAIRD